LRRAWVQLKIAAMSEREPETSEQRLARWVSFVMSAMLALLMLALAIWAAIDQRPLPPEVAAVGPGEKLSDWALPLAVGGMAVTLLVYLWGAFRRWRRPVRRPARS
jgi:hypothetical protein